jgi:hypothetical protein
MIPRVWIKRSNDLGNTYFDSLTFPLINRLPVFGAPKAPNATARANGPGRDNSRQKTGGPLGRTAVVDLFQHFFRENVSGAGIKEEIDRLAVDVDRNASKIGPAFAQAVNLLRPAQGETFVARAEVIKAGKTLTVVRADVFAMNKNEERQLVATMQGTMICVDVPE